MEGIIFGILGYEGSPLFSNISLNEITKGSQKDLITDIGAF